MNEYIRELIKDYLHASDKVMTQMKRFHNLTDIWGAYLSGEVPKKGLLSESTNDTYWFHGVGCYFQLGEIKIDIDFGPTEVGDGFDAWRLVKFAKETMGVEDLDINMVKSKLESMLQSGKLIRKPDWSEQLYFLSEEWQM